MVSLAVPAAVFGVPVEELAFFLLTNVLVVSAFLLLDWVAARVRASGGARVPA